MLRPVFKCKSFVFIFFSSFCKNKPNKLASALCVKIFQGISRHFICQESYGTYVKQKLTI